MQYRSQRTHAQVSTQGGGTCNQGTCNQGSCNQGTSDHPPDAIFILRQSTWKMWLHFSWMQGCFLRASVQQMLQKSSYHHTTVWH